MGLHANLGTADGIHIPYAWTYAGQTEREAASGFVAADVGKFARQLDDDSIYMLVAVTPIWVRVGGGGDTPTLLVFTCRKGSSGTIPQGAPVYLVGWNAGGWAEVEPAKANSSSTMPAIGLARTELTSAAEGEAVAFGVITSIDTSSYSIGDLLYVSATTAGGLTATRPTGDSSLVQIVAKVLKVDASTGQLLVDGAGRVNALPNLAAGKYWKGDADGIPAEAVPFGAEAGDAESLAQSFTTSTSWVQKVRFTTPAAIPAGRYRVGWSFEWQYESAANDYLCQVQVDDTTTIMEMVQEPADAGSDQWNPKSGFGYVDLTNDTHFVDLDYRAGNGLYSAHIRRARLEFWRVS